MALFVVIPFVGAEATDTPSHDKLPITIEWTQDGKAPNNAKHKSNIEFTNTSYNEDFSNVKYEVIGNKKIEFDLTGFNKPGKYVYLVKQTNDDFKTANGDVKYDKTVYRVIVLVQNNQGGGTSTTVYAYDESKYEDEKSGTGKVSDIKFTNTEPKDPTPPTPPTPNPPGPTPGPGDDNHIVIPFPWWPWQPIPWPIGPDNPDRPVNPDNPNLPTDPNNPTDPTRPVDPTRPPRSDTGKGEPWWWDVIIPDKPFDPANPIVDPSDPKDPTKPVDRYKPNKPWWWDILYPDTPYDPENPDKPVEPKPDNGYNKPWWWDKLFPDTPFDPDNPKVPTKPTDDDDGTSDPIRDGDDKDKTDQNNNGDSTGGKENEDPTDPNQPTDDDDVNQATKDDQKDGKKGKAKNGKGNVQTGIESVAIWALILCIALGLYKLTTKAKNKA